jgi:hypothetical protein
MEMPASGIYPIYISADGAVYDADSYVAEAVELPPHGDLIDRDAILNAERNKPISKMMMFGGTYVYDESVINDAPVVVPAERREG